LKNLLGIEVAWFTYPYHIVTFAELNILFSYVESNMVRGQPKILRLNNMKLV